MKLSAWHKSHGDQVSIDEPEPDIIYISSPFTFANQYIDYTKMFPNAKIEYGGYGFNCRQLPYEIEHIMPDYSIFFCNFSIGYTTRGCIRTCPFCIVPQMEGSIKKWAHPEEFWDQDHDSIMLLDNNWLAIPYWFDETSKWIIDHNLTLFEHGMDIRLLTEKNIKRVRDLKIKPNYKFAFDSSNLTNIIVDKIRLLEENGFNLKREVSFYVYLDSDSDQDFNDVLNRCKLLKQYGTNAFLMFNINNKRTHRVKQLQGWVNRRWIYWSCDFEQYDDSYLKHK